MYSLDIKPEVDRKFKKIRLKNPRQMGILLNKINQVLINPHHFKPLKGDMKGARRVHIDKSFVLVYEINENEKVVTLLDYEHHDKIY
jgi:YafQ family addiction module toxin component